MFGHAKLSLASLGFKGGGARSLSDSRSKFTAPAFDLGRRFQGLVQQVLTSGVLLAPRTSIGVASWVSFVSRSGSPNIRQIRTLEETLLMVPRMFGKSGITF